MAATVTLFDVAAKRGGATFFDGTHGAPLLWQQRRTMRNTESFSVLTEDVGDFKRRVHQGCAR